MRNVMSANVSEAVEKIARDMKKIITYAPFHEVYYTVCIATAYNHRHIVT